jgi:hypothetical protein
MKIRNSKFEIRNKNSKSQFSNVQTLQVLFRMGASSFVDLILRILVIVSGFEIWISNLC